MPDVLERPAPDTPARPRVRALAAGQIGYAGREFLRTPVAALVSVGLPLVFLFVTGLVADAQPVDPATGLAAIQRTAPAAAVFATLMAAYVILPFTVAVAREQGILKRLRGTPLPTSAYLAGKVAVAVAVALVGTALMLAAGVVAFELEIVWRALPAAFVTLVVGVAAFALLGFAILAVLRASQAVLATTVGSLVIVGFVSDVFTFGAAPPRWLDVTGWVLPLRHFMEAFAGAFDPAAPAAGFAAGHLAVVAAWGVAGAIVASRWLDWEDRRPGTARVERAGSVRRPAPRAPRRPATPVAGAGPLRLVWEQTRHANKSVWREPVSAFFALAFPTLFVVILPLVTGNPVIGGTSFAEHMTTSMPIFGLALTAYVTLPEAVAAARDRGVLKRLRGTPLPSWAYLAGRVSSVFWITALTVAVVFAAGWLVHDVTTTLGALPALAVVVLLTTACLAALGMAVSALVPDAKSVPGVTLATFMPLAFISDIFPVGDVLPELAQTIGWVFPIKHAVHALRDAFTAGALAADHLTVIVGWAALGIAVALWRFRWTREDG